MQNGCGDTREAEKLTSASPEVCQFEMQSKEKQQEHHTLPHEGNTRSCYIFAFKMEETPWAYLTSGFPDNIFLSAQDRWFPDLRVSKD